jgi:protein involved in polysaccharide export with SLBB domain
MTANNPNKRRRQSWWRRFRPHSLLALALLACTAFSAPVAAQVEANYSLGPGDKLRIIVFGEEDLTGEFEVSGSGIIAYPLIGQLQVAGRTLNEVEQIVRTKLMDGYLKNPSVSAEVLNYRPFFIEGEVNEPGQYPYVNGMTVREAVAIAGGYTYRAREESAIVIRRSDPNRSPEKVAINTSIQPGDYIKIEERFF